MFKAFDYISAATICMLPTLNELPADICNLMKGIRIIFFILQGSLSDFSLKLLDEETIKLQILLECKRYIKQQGYILYISIIPPPTPLKFIVFPEKKQFWGGLTHYNAIFLNLLCTPFTPTPLFYFFPQHPPLSTTSCYF